METLVIVAHHRNNYYGSKGKRCNPTRGFRDISCRTFEIGSGLLPNPNPSPNSFKTDGSQVLNQAVSSSPTLQTPGNVIANSSGKSTSEDARFSKRVVRSSSPIPIKLKDVGKMKERPSRGNLCFSELWAGPAYSNSPPPSSLPIPKFSMKPKRSVSLEFPVHDESDLSFPSMAKSAPCSPTGEYEYRDWSADFLSNDDSATKTLRRILNLDVADDGGGEFNV